MRSYVCGFACLVAGLLIFAVPVGAQHSDRASVDQDAGALPLLDHHVTIHPGTRSIAEHAKLMADELSRQTGLHVSCCQAFVAGVPWGTAKIPFTANDMPAHQVLTSLIRLEQLANSQASKNHPIFDHWTVTCDATGAPWCFIEVARKSTP